MKTLPSRKNMLLVSLLIIAVAITLVLVQRGRVGAPIRIGVLHSLTGVMAASEAPLVDAVRLAVEEANRSGGVDGRQVEIISVDCRSDSAYCAEEAERLIGKEGVQALFGCWTSSCRKAVKSVVEKHQSLLFYPLQYEGLESSSNIIYTGATPNQQVIPMVLWAMQQRGKRVYLIGSDYVYPRTVNRQVKDILSAQGGQVIGERYLPLGGGDISAAVNDIVAQEPDYVLNTLNGQNNRLFFKALHDAGITADKLPVFSTSIGEVELAEMGADLMLGHYAAWGYFQSLDNAINKDFVSRFKRRFGQDRVLSDPMEASYISASLWLSAVRELGATDPAMVRNMISLQSMPAPEGIVTIDPVTMHLWRYARIGRARADGQFDVVWASEHEIRPSPFQYYRNRSDWSPISSSSQEAVR